MHNVFAIAEKYGYNTRSPFSRESASMSQSAIRSIPSLIRSRGLVFTVALSFYWSFFVLFPFPAELFPSFDYNHSLLQFDIVIFTIVVVLALVFLVTGERLSAWILSHPILLAGSLLCFITLAILSLLFQVSGISVPSALFWLFAVALSLFGFFLTVYLAHETRFYSWRLLAVITTSSLLLSFVFGTVFVFVADTMNIAQSDANYFLLIVSGVISLYLVSQRSGNAELGEDPSSDHDDHLTLVSEGSEKDPFLVTGFFMARPLGILILVAVFSFFLLGSGIFLGIHNTSTGSAWISYEWLHGFISIILYSFFLIYALVGYKRAREVYPWVFFIVLCLIVLYSAALFYPTFGIVCAEITLPSRPLAMVLLWILAIAWSRKAKRAASWAVPVIVLPLSIMVDLTLDLVSQSSYALANVYSVLNTIVLITAFAVTLGFIFVVVVSIKSTVVLGMRDSLASREAENVSNDVSQARTVALISKKYDLSKREEDVLLLLSEGNTQKKIAEKLFISLNSVQTYAKSLYRKLGIHSRQELIDLVNQTR